MSEEIEGPHRGKGRLINAVKGALTPKVSPKQEGANTQMSMADSILLNARIPPLPSYYAGLPANVKHVNGDRLLQIYSALERRVSLTAAQNFVRMVRDMPTLAGSNFVKAIQALEKDNWLYDPHAPGTMTVGPKDIKSEADCAGFAAGAAAVQAGAVDPLDQTLLIKAQFARILDQQGIHIPDAPIIDAQGEQQRGIIKK